MTVLVAPPDDDQKPIMILTSFWYCPEHANAIKLHDIMAPSVWERTVDAYSTIHKSVPEEAQLGVAAIGITDSLAMDFLKRCANWNAADLKQVH